MTKISSNGLEGSICDEKIGDSIIGNLVLSGCWYFCLKLLSFSDVSIIHDTDSIYLNGIFLLAWPIALFVDGILNTGTHILGKIVVWIAS